MLLFLNRSATGWRETVVSLLWQRVINKHTFAILSCTNLVLYAGSVLHCWSFIKGWSCVFGKIIRLSLCGPYFLLKFHSTKQEKGEWAIVKFCLIEWIMVRLLRTTIGSDPLRIQLLIVNMGLGNCFLLRISAFVNNIEFTFITESSAKTSN